nr:cytochrome c oxidase subunit III [Kinnaridae sp.]
MKSNHPFHLVSKSPWPIMLSINLLTVMLSLLKWLHFNMSINLLILTILINLLISFQWWRDINRESTFQGFHTKKVIKGMKMGMILFISSEIMFFLAFFWTFFHSSLSPAIQIGMLWPPKLIKPFNPLEIPLLNTIILLTSGATITWAHHSLLNNKMKETNKSTLLTIILGLYFTILQSWEYKESSFTISDSIYGSSFFMSTGFHGIHVMIGTTFILFTLLWSKNLHLNMYSHLGFEAASWYWHFVDVVWLILYLSIYWWGK